MERDLAKQLAERLLGAYARDRYQPHQIHEPLDSLTGLFEQVPQPMGTYVPDAISDERVTGAVVAGGRLYHVIADLTAAEQGNPPVTIASQPLRPDRATITLSVKLVDGVIEEREWEFQLSEDDVVTVRSRLPVDSKPDEPERFARALAAELGWRDT